MLGKQRARAISSCPTLNSKTSSVNLRFRRGRRNLKLTEDVLLFNVGQDEIARARCFPSIDAEQLVVEREHVVRVVEVVHAEALLLQVVRALAAARGFAGRLDGG